MSRVATPGYVYFLKAEDTSMVKIGKTKNDPKLRRKDIRNMSPVHLYSIGLLSAPDYSKLEREMHELFAPYRHHGEWFEFPDDQVSCLKRSVKRKKNKHPKDGGNMLFDEKTFRDFWNREIYG